MLPFEWKHYTALIPQCSEEYEPDARFNEAATSLDGPEATSLAKIDSEGYDRLVSFVRWVCICLLVADEVQQHVHATAWPTAWSEELLRASWVSAAAL